jgi:hypothetical protein
MFLKPVLLATAFATSTLAAFGITTSGSSYIVDAVSPYVLLLTFNAMLTV